MPGLLRECKPQPPGSAHHQSRSQPRPQHPQRQPAASPKDPDVVRVEDAETGFEVRRAFFAIPGAWPVTVVDEHGLLLVGYHSGQVHGRRSSAVDEEVFVWQIHERGVKSIALHGDLLVTAGADGAVRFTDWRTSKQALAPVIDCRWDNDAMLTAVVVAEPGGETAIWRVTNPAECCTGNCPRCRRQHF